MSKYLMALTPLSSNICIILGLLIKRIIQIQIMIEFHRNLQKLGSTLQQMLEIKAELNSFDEEQLTKLMRESDTTRKDMERMSGVSDLGYRQYISTTFPQKSAYSILVAHVMRSQFVQNSPSWGQRSCCQQSEQSRSPLIPLFSYLVKQYTMKHFKTQILNHIHLYINTRNDYSICETDFIEYLNRHAIRANPQFLFSILSDPQNRVIYASKMSKPTLQCPEKINSLDQILQRLQWKVENLGKQWMIAQKIGSDC